MEIRRAQPEDCMTLARLAVKMWEHDLEELSAEFESLTRSEDAVCFLAMADAERAVGFAQCQLRHDYVEGCDSSPVGFLEGVWVEEGYRRHGVARALLTACEAWARHLGCTEFASDCELDNTDSLRWHLNSGFAEVNRTIWFAKKL